MYCRNSPPPPRPCGAAGSAFATTSINSWCRVPPCGRNCGHGWAPTTMWRSASCGVRWSICRRPCRATPTSCASTGITTAGRTCPRFRPTRTTRWPTPGTISPSTRPSRRSAAAARSPESIGGRDETRPPDNRPGAENVGSVPAVSSLGSPGSARPRAGCRRARPSSGWRRRRRRTPDPTSASART